MSNIVHFERKLRGALNLGEIKQQAKQSWYSSQRMPTEVVDALLAEVEQLETVAAYLFHGNEGDEEE